MKMTLDELLTEYGKYIQNVPNGVKPHDLGEFRDKLVEKGMEVSYDPTDHSDVVKEFNLSMEKYHEQREKRQLNIEQLRAEVEEELLAEEAYDKHGF
jgi:hypothetical protein